MINFTLQYTSAHNDSFKSFFLDGKIRQLLESGSYGLKIKPPLSLVQGNEWLGQPFVKSATLKFTSLPEEFRIIAEILYCRHPLNDYFLFLL